MSKSTNATNATNAKKKKPRLKKPRITYRSGGEGCIKWCNENVRVPIYINGVPVWKGLNELPTEKNPYTGRSSADMWDAQKPILRQGLKMRGGKFIYRLIVLCWMRGDGKSLLACLIQLWKFFNFPRQQIMLGANSKDQVKFVHFDIMRDIILNSPNLLKIVGRRNVQEKEIRLKNKHGNIVSIIRSISSFSGIVSNITGYTFSEIFDMKNPKFFTQLDGSVRNVPNALGVIDSTVSAKEHVLYRLYDNSRKGLDKLTYFSYRSSPNADASDFWNPEMTQDQLNSYKTKFPPAEFDMYFKNLWESAAHKMFLPEQIMAMRYIGFNNQLGQHDEIINACKKHIELEEKRKEMEGNTYMEDRIDAVERNTKSVHNCTPLSNIYSLSSEYGQNRYASLEELNKLSEIYDTNFSILAGVDRADPMKKNLSFGAKTITTIIAKGLPGSKSNPGFYMQKENQVLKYFYFLIGLFHVERNDLDSIKSVLELCIDEYDGIDSLSAERWGMWDMADWCEENTIIFDPVTASYMKQKEGFSELFTLTAEGRFKAPPVGVRGNKKEDILEEEFGIFDHDPKAKFYGSPEKGERYGIQDDCMFSLNWGIYGGRMLGMDDMYERGHKNTLGEFFQNKSLEGAY